MTQILDPKPHCLRYQLFFSSFYKMALLCLFSSLVTCFCRACAGVRRGFPRRTGARTLLGGVMLYLSLLFSCLFFFRLHLVFF